MIIKGKSRAGPTSLAHHLGNAEKNERIQLLETRGTIAEDLRGALVEMDAVAAGTNCKKPLYHAALSPEPPHRLTPEQRVEAVDTLEKKLGLDGHQRVVVLHEKLGREHIHVVWSRIDVETMRSVHDGHNYRKHEECARDLERRFGHDRVQGAHAERDGPNGKVRRPERTPSRADLRQEERTGVTGKEVKAQVSEAFRASDGPEAFKAALEERGYQLARGDRRDYVVVDPAGGVHSLARRIDGMKAADLRSFMAPIDQTRLLSVDDLRTHIDELGRRAREASNDASLEKAYGRGDDYVSQSQAARKDHERRQAELERLNGGDGAWERIEAGEARRTQEQESGAGEDDERRERERRKDAAADPDLPETSHDSVDLSGAEMTDAMQERLSRLREHKAELRQSPGKGGPDRPREAPGGGRTRGR